ncbi:MAG: BrnT family toxin [Deltaproteobacteria bacterium]|nr:BrnT family toxin [Deltaproteobacteria bacterium]
MELFTRIEGFDWDSWNINKNKEKHIVTFAECEEVFFNSPIVVGEDKKHSSSEDRHYMLGKTDSGRLLFIVFTIRKNKIRVISARDMSKKERGAYHEQIEENTEV